MWVTLKPETTQLTPRILSEMMHLLAAVRAHADVFWQYDEDELYAIDFTKIDVAVDMKGSFMD